MTNVVDLLHLRLDDPQRELFESYLYSPFCMTTLSNHDRYCEKHSTLPFTITTTPCRSLQFLLFLRTRQLAPLNPQPSPPTSPSPFPGFFLYPSRV